MADSTSRSNEEQSNGSHRNSNALVAGIGAAWAFSNQAQSNLTQFDPLRAELDQLATSKETAEERAPQPEKEPNGNSSPEENTPTDEKYLLPPDAEDESEFNEDWSKIYDDNLKEEIESMQPETNHTHP